MTTLIGAATIVAVGMLVGVEFCVAVFVNRIVDPLPHDGGLAARVNGARLLGRVMPFWYCGSMALGVAWAALSWGSAGVALRIGGAALLAVSVVLSVTLLVPINNRARAWATNGAPDDWRDQLARWDRFHYLRVAVIVVALAVFAVAAVAG